jgi:hypothetical protein
VLSVVTQRQPTGLPGEMVTVGAIVEWRHDARVEPKPQQFEAPSIDLGKDKRDREANLKQQIVGGMFAQPDAGAEAMLDDEVTPLPADVDPADGFDYSQLDEEDVEEPVAAS